MARQLIVFPADVTYIDSYKVDVSALEPNTFETLCVPDAIQDVSAFVFFSTPHFSCNPNVQIELIKELDSLCK